MLRMTVYTDDEGTEILFFFEVTIPNIVRLIDRELLGPAGSLSHLMR